MCRTNSLDCELFSVPYTVNMNFAILELLRCYMDAVQETATGTSSRYADCTSVPRHHCAKLHALLKLTGCGSCHVNVFAKGNCAHKTNAKGMQPHWHLHIYMLHLKESAVAYFPGKGKSFFPSSSICSNFTLLQFPRVFCKHCCCNTFPFR